ncbi:alpha/beta hydrolase [Azoarcus sp. L1K30]|uniref:RBBP9/YdeN family alpha/beta hydrolase n=1 Tax=Azoarcus sp. L1K30 TaxID=2820277 RepID=UPI0020119491|nr:alpha/beta hydrolase [Azoarcus sp. L1K30]
MPATVLVLPGIGNSGPLHWQTLWEQSHPDFVRVHQRDWDNPVCADWVAAIEEAVRRARGDVVLVAHSLACLAVAHWAATPHSPVKAALLVAVPDPDGPNFPVQASGFGGPPKRPFAFRSTVVVSGDDPYGTPVHAMQLAAAWGSNTVCIGDCGHINASSGLGSWPAGFELLSQLCD